MFTKVFTFVSETGKKMVGNSQKKAEKILKNRVNPRGVGVMRFCLLEILLRAGAPLTITELSERLSIQHTGVTNKWVRRVIGEMKESTGTGLLLGESIKRVGRTKCPAYFIENISHIKQPKQYELFR